jgi:hypothetical protein
VRKSESGRRATATTVTTATAHLGRGKGYAWRDIAFVFDDHIEFSWKQHHEPAVMAMRPAIRAASWPADGDRICGCVWSGHARCSFKKAATRSRARPRRQ